MSTKQILVITSGFVLIGEVEPLESTYLVRNASIIRKWGTTEGLGEIALKGPTTSTVLDRCGTVEVERSAVIMRIRCQV